MKLYYFKQKSLDILEGEYKDNITQYMSDEPWVDKYFSHKDMAAYSFDTGIEIDAFQLIPGGDETDFENSKIVFNCLNGKIDRLQSTDLRFWAYMTHTVCWKYMRSRWPIEAVDNKESRILNRYFFDRAPYVRNGVARLFWTPFMTYDPDSDDHYQYTEYALSKQDIQLYSLERQLGRAHQLILGNLQALKERDAELKRNDIRLFYTKINQLGGVEVLDSLSREEALQVSRSIVEEVISLPQIYDGASVIARSQKSGTITQYVVDEKKLKINKTIFKTDPNNIIGLKIGMKFKVGNDVVQIIEIK